MYDISPSLVVWFDRHTSTDERKSLFNTFVDDIASPRLESYFATRFSAKDERWQGYLDDNSISYKVVFTKCGTEDCAYLSLTEYLGKLEQGGMPYEFQWRVDMTSRTIRPVSDAATDLEQYLPVYNLNHMSEEEYLNFQRSMENSR
jgi:hypothetical protein